MRDTDLVLWDFFNPFDFDRKFYKFNREEKDMHPYSIYHNEKEKTVTIVHNMLGINKEDLKLSKKKEDGVTYIVIAGKTTDEVTNKTYSINSRFSVDEKELDLDKVKSSLKNGLLYVTIPYNENKNKEEKESFINID